MSEAMEKDIRDGVATVRAHRYGLRMPYPDVEINTFHVEAPRGPIPFAWHSYGREEAEAIAAFVQSGGPIVNGPRVAAFEAAFAAYVGAKHAIATSSCTSALEASCLVAGLGPGFEAVTTPYTFTATANAARRTGATVRFADVAQSAYHMDQMKAVGAVGPKTKAVLVVHYAGLALSMGCTELEDTVRSVGGIIIEDAAQAAGSHYPDGSRVGSNPHSLCCFSFGPEKIMTTGYGGMITTGNADLAAKLRRIIRQGLARNGAHRDQTDPGINASMGEIQAALGIVQLAKLDGFIGRRHQLDRAYRKLLDGVDGVELPGWTEMESNGALFPVRLRKRQKAIEELAAAGISTAIHYKPVHLHSAWSGVAPRGAYPHAEIAGSWELSLPLYPGLEERDVERVAEIVRRVHVG